MLKSKLTLTALLALGAMGNAANGAAAAVANIKRAAQQSPGPRGGRGRSRGHKLPAGGKRYPEQSSRQELRGFRRARGGPGLVLVGGEYQVRDAL